MAFVRYILATILARLLDSMRLTELAFLEEPRPGEPGRSHTGCHAA